MIHLRSLFLAGAAASLATGSAFAEAPARVRGVVTTIDDKSITVKGKDGSAVTLTTGDYTTYAEVVPSSLDEIKVDDFIGTASKGPIDHWVAVEIVIIPPSMQGGRKGYAGWDPLPDWPNSKPSKLTATTMTNGSVARISEATPPLTNTTMTNGKVAASSNSPGGHIITLTYDGTKTSNITVPSTAPITRFVPAERSAIAVGSTVFIKTNPGNQAALVAAGKGVTPPM